MRYSLAIIYIYCHASHSYIIGKTIPRRHKGRPKEFSLIIITKMKTVACLLLIAVCLVTRGEGCEANCETCRDLFPGDYFCLACKAGYEVVTTYGICIQENTISNCALYDQTLDCLTCQPSFQQSVNLCSKMFDGCLLYRKGTCSLCQAGSFPSPSTQACTVTYLHCTKISSDGSCASCSPSYSLSNNRCLYNSTLCTSLNPDTGLCQQCSSGSVLIGYTCVPSSNSVIKNCYLAEQGTNITCTSCKSGYAIYFGSCRPLKQLIGLMPLFNESCQKIDFLKDNQQSCLSSSYNLTINRCLTVDLGLQRCLTCQSLYTLSPNNECVPIVTLFCSELSKQGDKCLKCKETFYLEKGECVPFPPFCLNYSNGCTQCKASFELTAGRCLDPNCQTVNLVTGYCQICFINYQINPSGVCKYIDQNCKKTGALGDCLQCQKGYYLKNNGLCAYQDTNCLSFDNGTGLCTLCKPFYYFNRQGQICIPLPANCIAADIAGRCTTCMDQYTLTSSYQCLFIPSISNCKMISSSNYSFCTSCISGFFADQEGRCQKLPAFCQQIDPNSYACTQCSPNGVMKDGSCVDKNCQIFDSEGSCLACLSSFQFGQLGECVPETRDINCKEYQFGICKTCSERYYFDFQFNCVPVSAFCKTYEANSGACTSCYSGYQLTNNVDCTVAPFNSIFVTPDVLDACLTTNAQGLCTKCNPNFNQVLLMTPLENGSKPLVNCIQKINDNSYCLHFDVTSSRCTQCVSRMYTGKDGNCKSIDQNCQKYDSSSGVCTACYAGFTTDPKNNRTCVIIHPQDPNCEIKSNSSGCLKCYSRYYYEPETLTCTQVNPQCATFDSKNGRCTSCYPGYQLKNYLCVLKPNEPQNTPLLNGTTNKSKIEMNNQVKKPNCLNMDFQKNECLTCEWGYSLVSNACLPKDLHCKTFQDSNSLVCLECYDGYSVFPNDQTKCVLTTLLLPHCLKYSPSVECQQCEDGYVLSANQPAQVPAYVCNIIDPNCLTYNASKKACEKCTEGHVLQGRSCIFPIYGVDVHCLLYSQEMCVRCENGWSIKGYICSQL